MRRNTETDNIAFTFRDQRLKPFFAAILFLHGSGPAVVLRRCERGASMAAFVAAHGIEKVADAMLSAATNIFRSGRTNYDFICLNQNFVTHLIIWNDIS